MAVGISRNVISVEGRDVFWAPFPVETVLEEGPWLYVLFDGYYSDGETAKLYPHNVLCVGKNGQIRWKVIPAAPDARTSTFVGLRFECGNLLGVTFDGAYCQIDKNSGRASLKG